LRASVELFRLRQWLVEPRYFQSRRHATLPFNISDIALVA